MDQYHRHWGADRVLSATSSSISGSAVQLGQIVSGQGPIRLSGKLRGRMPGSPPPPPTGCSQSRAGAIRQSRGRVF